MLRTVLFVVLFAAILRAAIASPLGALLGYLWFALFRPQEWVWMDISQLRLSLLLGCILLIRSLSTSSLPNIKHPISIGMVAFLATGLIAQLNAVNQALGWEWLSTFFRLTLISLLLITLVDSKRRFYYTIITIASSLGFHTSKAGFASIIGGGVQYSDGLAGSFTDSNGYALAAVMIVPLLHAVQANVPEGWPLRKGLTWGYRSAIPLTCYMVISTFSRGGLLALFTVVFSYVMFQRRRFTILCALALTLLFVMPFIPLPEGYNDRVKTIVTYEDEEETSAISRLHFWRVALIMAADNPLGVGMFNSGAMYNRYDFSDGRYGRSRALHSSHLQVLTEHGFAGFIIWIWLFFYSFRTCFRIRNFARMQIIEGQHSKFFESMATALFVTLVAFFAGGSFISLALNDLTWIVFALVAALERLFYATAK